MCFESYIGYFWVTSYLLTSNCINSSRLTFGRKDLSGLRTPDSGPSVRNSDGVRTTTCFVGTGTCNPQQNSGLRGTVTVKIVRIGIECSDQFSSQV